MLNLEGGYLGFTFNGRHSSEFGLMVVSDGDRYHQTLSPSFSDTVVTVPGKNGGYYFGTQLQNKDFTINCAFNEMTTHMLHDLQNWLYPNKTGWLILDETPYKKYWVKISNIIEPTFVPFDEVKVIKNYTIQQEIVKGELQISFFSFNEFAYENEEYDLPQILENEIITQQALDSGLIPYNYSHDGICFPHEYLQKISSETDFNFWIYNAGNGVAAADFYFTIDKNEISDNNPLSFFNYDNGESYIITNPASIISGYGIDINEIKYYRIKILGSRAEIWLECWDNDKKILPNTQPINIGGCYNQYYPKILHTRPTDIMVMSQNYNEGQIEPLFFPYSYGNPEFYSSDTFGNYDTSFEGLKKRWSSYIILTHDKTISINNNINPVFNFIHNESGEDSKITNQLVYLIYPNKFYCDKTIYDFVVEYKHTYI